MKTKIQNVLRGTALVLLGAAASSSVASAAQGPQPSICTRTCWGARNGTCTTTMSSLTRAIIHHTAGPGDFTTDYAAAQAKVRGVQNLHMDSNGWCDIGYHFMVSNGGHIFEGRKNSMTSWIRGSHAGCGNNNSFGFTFLGYFHPPYNHNPSTAMQNAMYDVIAWRMPSGWSPYGGRTSYPGSLHGTGAPLDTHSWVGASTGSGCAGTACPGSIIINNYITSDFNGGPMRNGIWNRKNPGAWNNWHVPTPGYSASAPGLIATKGGTRVMFIQGGGNILYHSVWTGSWSGWMALGGLSVNSTASACNRAGTMLDVVVRGTDNNIHMRNWNGSSWGGWYIPVPGYAASAPTVVDRQDGKLSIFITGAGGIIYEAVWTGSAWTGWYSHASGQPAIAGSAVPAACSRSVGAMDLAVKGNDGKIWMKNFNGTSWSGWYVPVAGSAATDPALVATGNGTMSIVIVGGGNLVYQAKWTGTSWTGYTSVNGGLGFANTRPAACSLGTGKIDVAVRGGLNAYTPNDYIWMCNFQ